MASVVVAVSSPSTAHAARRPPRTGPVVAAAAAAMVRAEGAPTARPPEATDPLLAPVGAAPRNVGSLQDIVTALKRRSADLRQAMADVRRAEGQWRIALAAALPTITGQGSAVHQLITVARTSVTDVGAGTRAVVRTELPEANVAQGSAVLTQPVVALSAWKGVAAASVDEDASRLSLEETKRRLTESVLGAALAVATAERAAAAQREGLRAALARDDLARRRLRAGTGTTLDEARALLDVDGARAALLAADEALLQSREALGLALGFGGPVGVEGEGTAERLLAEVDRACAPLPSPLARSDVAVERLHVEAAEHRVDQVWLQLVPTLSARADTTASTATLTSLPPVVASVQGVLSVPLWDGGARYGALRVAEANLDAAREHAADVERQAAVEVQRDARGVRVAEGQAAVAQAARGHAAEAERLQRVAFGEGRGTSLELVIAGAALRDAESTLLLRELGVLQARLTARVSLATCRW